MFSPIPDYIPSIHHDGSARYVRLQGEAKIGDTVTIRLRADARAPVERVLLRLCPDGEQQFIEMHSEETRSQDACQWWSTGLRLSMPITGYRFLIFTKDGAWWYTGSGAQRGLPTDASDFRLLAGYQAPTWVRSSVFYQIFPDRFADGDPASNVRDGEFEYRGLRSTARRWGEPPNPNGYQAMVEFYGGDLPGIQQRLDTIAELGANALYLNPIFSAYSNHRYDVIDYENVDPHLGGNAALAGLRQALAERGMHYILDIVPNHCGFMHPWFQAAQKDLKVPSAEFFTFHKHPEEYESWLGVRSLPKLNYRSLELRQQIYAGPEAVFRRWLRPPFTADGWRIDVANMLGRQGAEQLGMEIGRGIRKAVKEENPQAYLLGENFFDGSEQLQGDFLDANMNYSGFFKPLRWWLTHLSVNAHGQPRPFTAETPWPAQAMLDSWQAFRAAIPWTIARQQFNLLGSHDTSRILTLLGGDERLARLAAVLLMTYPGVPCVYYGEEIGLNGDSSLTARGCMPWEQSEWNLPLRQFYQALIHLRRTSPALIEGGFQVLWVEDDSLAFLRDAEQERLIVVAHRGPSEHPAVALPVAHGAIPDGMHFQELFSGWRSRVENGRLALGPLPVGAQIWRTT